MLEDVGIFDEYLPVLNGTWVVAANDTIVRVEDVKTVNTANIGEDFKPALEQKRIPGYTVTLFRFAVGVLLGFLRFLADVLLFWDITMFEFVEDHTLEWVTFHLCLAQLGMNFESVLGFLMRRVSAMLDTISREEHENTLRRNDVEHRMALNAKDEEIAELKNQLAANQQLIIGQNDQEIATLRAELEDQSRLVNAQKTQLEQLTKVNSEQAKALYDQRMAKQFTQLKAALEAAPKDAIRDMAYSPRPAHSPVPPHVNPAFGPPQFNPAAAHFVPRPSQFPPNPPYFNQQPGNFGPPTGFGSGNIGNMPKQPPHFGPPAGRGGNNMGNIPPRYFGH